MIHKILTFIICKRLTSTPLVLESGTTLIGGDKLAIGTSYGQAFLTLAATGTYQGYNAFLTCGHGMEVGDSVYYSDTTDPIGTIVLSYGNNPNGEFDGDFSIGKLNSSFYPSHKARTGSSSTVFWKGICSRPEKGRILRKYGSTSGYAYLEVTESNTSRDLGYGNLKKISVAKITSGSSAHGDSGGPYWTADALEFCGVHVGVLYDKLHVVFTPYEVINGKGFSVNASHNGSWAYYSSAQHKMYCSICKDYVYQSHTGSWSDYNSTYHKAYCSVCKSTVYEPHSAYYNNALGKCTRCGRTGNFTLNFVDFESSYGSYPEEYSKLHIHCD